MCFKIQRKRTNEHTFLPGLGNIRIRIGHVPVVPSDAITPQPAVSPRGYCFISKSRRVVIRTSKVITPVSWRSMAEKT